MILSVEGPFVGAFAVRIPGAALLHRNGLVRAVLPASTEHGERTLGVPQELGRSCRFLCEFPAGDTGITTPGLDGALVRRGAKRTSGRGGTAKRSAAGWAAGSRSALIVPLKQGNSPRTEDPVEGSEASAGRLDRGTHAEHIEVLTHVHGTRANSCGDPSGMANLSAEEPYALM